MASRQGKPRSPQIPRGQQLRLLIAGLMLQAGLATKKEDDGKGNIVVKPVPKAPAVPFIVHHWNNALKALCAKTNKSFETFKLIVPTAEKLGTLPGKLNTLRAWYLEQYARLPADKNPEIKRDYFGNVRRSDIATAEETVIDGETVTVWKVKPEFADVATQAVFYGDDGYELEGMPAMMGRTSSVPVVTGDDFDDYSFDDEEYAS